MFHRSLSQIENPSPKALFARRQSPSGPARIFEEHSITVDGHAPESFCERAPFSCNLFHRLRESCYGERFVHGLGFTQELDIHPAEEPATGTSHFDILVGEAGAGFPI